MSEPVPMVYLPVPAFCRVSFLVWPDAGGGLRVRLAPFDGGTAVLRWSGGAWRDPGDPDVRSGAEVSLREGLRLAAWRVRQRLSPDVLDSLCSQLSDPGAFRDMMSVMSS